MAECMAGQGEKWRKLKSHIIQHMAWSTDGQTHFKELRMLSEERKLHRIHSDAAETLLKCALTEVKSKAAALHYESQVALHFLLVLKLAQRGTQESCSMTW